MPARVSLRTDFTADDLRKLAAKSSDAHQSRRLLSLAAVRDGVKSRFCCKFAWWCAQVSLMDMTFLSFSSAFLCASHS